MGAISGRYGAVYYNAELTNTAIANTIIFSSGDQTITSSTAGGVGSSGKIDFESTGYKEGMLFDLSGAGTTENNRTFTIDTVTSGIITVDEAVTSSTGTGLTDTGTIKFLEAEPGIPVCGFYNWGISYTAEVFDNTDFCSAPSGRTYIPGITGWTATATKHFLTADNVVDDWVGATVKIRLFTKYVASPSSTGPSQYWSGDTIVTGLDESTPVDALIDQSISLQGDKALTLKTQTDPWSCGISST